MKVTTCLNPLHTAMSIYGCLLDYTCLLYTSACEKQLGTGTDRISGDVTSMGGDVAKWKKYANAIRMRYAMRISDVNPQQAKEEFEKAVAAGAIASAADDAYTVAGERGISMDKVFNG